MSKLNDVHSKLKKLTDIQDKGLVHFDRTGPGGNDLIVWIKDTGVEGAMWNNARYVQNLLGSGDIKPDKMSGNLIITHKDFYKQNNKESGTVKESEMEADPTELPEPDVSKDAMTTSSNYRKPMNFLPGVFWWGGHYPNLFQKSNAGKPKKDKKKKLEGIEQYSKSYVFMKLMESSVETCNKCSSLTLFTDNECQMCEDKAHYDKALDAALHNQDKFDNAIDLIDHLMSMMGGDFLSKSEWQNLINKLKSSYE